MRILIITEYIAPVKAVAALRWTKIGKYLSRNHDCTIDVLTNKKCYQAESLTTQHYSYDTSLEDDLRYFNNVYEIPDSPQTQVVNALYNLFDSLRRTKSRSMHPIEANETRKPDGRVKAEASTTMFANMIPLLFNLFVSARDRPRIKKAMKANVPWEAYDVIISSYGPKWVHLIGELAKNQNPHLIWVADYRDPLVFSKQTDTAENRLFPSVHTGEADCITFVAPQLEELHLDSRQNAMCLSNGFDPEEAIGRERKAATKFLISITGSLYDDGTNMSDLTPLFRALSDLIRQGRIDRSSIEVRYCGKNEDRFLNQIASYDSLPYRSNGLVPREEALKLQDESSLLVLPVWNSEQSKGVISGRIFEYLSSRAPIVALCSGNLPDSIIKDIVLQAGAGFCYEEACSSTDYAALTQFIEREYLEWLENGITKYEANNDYISSFQYDNVAKMIYDEICHLLSK